MSVGHNTSRRDGPDKVTGRTRFTIDSFPPRVLHAALRRSDIAAGRIIRLDTTRARALDGVRAVVTADDAPGFEGIGIRDRQLFAGELIRYVGEPMAAVAADTVEIAQLACTLIDVEIEEYEPIVRMQDALADDARLIHPDWELYDQMTPGTRGRNVAWEATVVRGNTDAAFARQDVTVVESSFDTGRQNQAYFEPRVCVASFEDGRYTVQTSTQVPWTVRSVVAELLDVPESSVRVTVPAVGGAFGGKFEAALEAFAALLAQRTRRTVRIANSRQEEMLTAPARDNAEIKIRSAIDPDGRIVAREATVMMDAGAYSGEQGFLTAMTAYTLGGVYELGAVRFVTQAVYTNTPPTGAFRSCCGTYNSFALELHTREICAAVGMDQSEFVRLNAIRDGSLNAIGQRMDGDIIIPMLDRMDTLRTQTPRTLGGSVVDGKLEDGRLYGSATVVGAWFVFVGPSACTVNLNPDGGVTVVTSGVEIGSGSMMQSIPQIVAETLGISTEAVTIRAADTDSAGYDVGVGGGRTTVSLGGASTAACEEVRKKMVLVAADLLEAAPDDLEFANGAIHVAGIPQISASIREIARHAQNHTGPISGSGSFNRQGTERLPGCLAGHMVDGIEMPIYTIHDCEIAVDPGTGHIEVLSYRTVQDVGRAINPRAIGGQIQGGIVQGLGYAIHEEITIDRGGRIEQTGFETYRLPGAADVVPVAIDLFEGAPSYGPLGSKGAGEIPTVAVAAAIGTAVSTATGKRVQSIPLTPPRVWSLINDIETSPSLDWISSSWRENVMAEPHTLERDAGVRQ
ncbi:aldehyde oxidase [Rhodococcoides fascians]|uniref:xanthine dehydrogenase family protein molybdopterin-binding subunit n=1 Tax=Rhodococcoides fascians TaxID=1828 RepID=UPI000B9B16B8|nr:xanthine dehydrogenase family protein molybdopterin-binding subunit [Rhodococcus fascians]OZE85344.1 aldehyde oxidase [Rhodococcus fascians]OZF11851.1 aldehyde oxidase [Rhodococcus fascians]OZF14620.1 aldehyde oxidase [Rhodococcus fascians]OZF71395.1 aldehyde oxidase [Rhodococcus fascians]OZF72867.1 aldehyde oxidase [Rhodococcus fascians]